MRDNPRDIKLLRHLAAMPFLDRLELALLSGNADRTTYDAVVRLEGRGFVASVRHATEAITTTRRLYVTPAGLRHLAHADFVSLDQVLRHYPVSGHWQRLLLGRLDAVAVLYRLACMIADASGGLRKFQWYRANPLDAGVVLPDVRVVGLLRQGPNADKTGFAKGVLRLLEAPYFDLLLVLVPDKVRLRHARRLLLLSRDVVLLTEEANVTWATAQDRVWQLRSMPRDLSLSEALPLAGTYGLLPQERERLSDVPDLPDRAPEHLLPALLKPAEKRALDLLADWPWLTADNLGGMLGVTKVRTSQLTVTLTRAGLACRYPIEGRERLAPTGKGLAVLARWDRTAAPRLQSQWSGESLQPEAPFSWRHVEGRRSRLLARHLAHTTAVHRFLSGMAEQARAIKWRLQQMDPPHRAARHFRHSRELRSIHPDAFGVVRGGGKRQAFFLESERRAVRPGTMAARLAPYLRYYSAKQPVDDHGVVPLVLIVFDDALAEARFHAVARREMRAWRVKVPLWVTHTGALKRDGPLGAVWRNPDHLEPTFAFAMEGPQKGGVR